MYMSVHSPCPKSPALEIERPIGGGPRVFSAGVLVLQKELKVELETLRKFSEITIGSVLLQMAQHC